MPCRSNALRLAGPGRFGLGLWNFFLFGPPPPNVGAIAWAGHAMWLLVLWGYWVDRHRQPRLKGT